MRNPGPSRLQKHRTLLPPAAAVALSRQQLPALGPQAGDASLLRTWPPPVGDGRAPPCPAPPRLLEGPAQPAAAGGLCTPSLSPRLPFPVLLSKTQSEPSLSCRGTVSPSRPCRAAACMAGGRGDGPMGDCGPRRCRCGGSGEGLLVRLRLWFGFSAFLSAKKRTSFKGGFAVWCWLVTEEAGVENGPCEGPRAEPKPSVWRRQHFSYLCSPVLTCTHLYSPVLSCAHLHSPVLTCTHLYSPVLICAYPCSPVLTCAYLRSPVLGCAYLYSSVLTCTHLHSPLLTCAYL